MPNDIRKQYIYKNNDFHEVVARDYENDFEVTLTLPGEEAQTLMFSAFKKHCEDNDYEEEIGAIVSIPNCIDGKTIRFILIGTNHDILSADDDNMIEPHGAFARTTWQFYDIPVVGVTLGLQFDYQDKDQDDGYYYPSNKHGYGTAVTLLQTTQDIYNAMPEALQKSMKLVRKDIMIPRICITDDYSEIADHSTITFIENEGDRYGSRIHCKMFSLSASEVGYTGNDFATTCDYDDNTYEVEGHRYAYFSSGDTQEARTKRVRYYKSEAYNYWLRSPYLSNSNIWGGVASNGIVGYYSTSDSNGVAFAFCI